MLVSHRIFKPMWSSLHSLNIPPHACISNILAGFGCIWIVYILSTDRLDDTSNAIDIFFFYNRIFISRTAAADYYCQWRASKCKSSRSIFVKKYCTNNNSTFNRRRSYTRLFVVSVLRTHDTSTKCALVKVNLRC